jgi:hypothetical protein
LRAQLDETMRVQDAVADGNTMITINGRTRHVISRTRRLGATPYRLAGRSLRPSRPSLTRMCLRSGLHASAGHIRRLNGRGSPSPPQLNGPRARRRCGRGSRGRSRRVR